MRKICRTILCIAVSIFYMQFNSYAASEAELLNQTNQLYATVKANNNNMSFDGLCSAYVYQQMTALGLGGPSAEYANQWYGAASQRPYSDTGYQMIASLGRDSLRALYQKYNVNGELYYLVVSFPYQYRMSYDNPGAGHAVFIYAIKDNKVFFSESYSSKQFGYQTNEGQAVSVDLDSFINLYSSMYGEPIGTVFFKVKEGWDSSQGYYRYGLPSGQYAKKQFVDLGRDQKYYFDKNGKMVTSDWLKADGKWYHAAADGHMDLGWQYLDSEWYYFNDPAGDMKTNGWETFEGKRYFLSNDGACIRNRNEYIDGKNWYFDEDGAASEITIVQGWNQIGNGKKYIFSDNSYATSQFVDLGRNQKYYFNADEWLVTSNWITHKGKLYHAAADGHMDLGWQYLDSEWYYFNDPEGDMKVNGWETFEGKRYYLSSSGARYRNTIQTIDGTAYRFDQDGAASEQSTGQEQSSVPRSGSSRAVREYRDNKQASSSSDKSKMQAVTGQAKPQ